MLRLLSSIAGMPMNGMKEDKKYSRFNPKHERKELAPPVAARPQPEPRRRSTNSYRVAPQPTAMFDTEFDEMSQSVGNAAISISILRKALPNRFAKMQ